MRAREFKDGVYGHFARMGAAFGHAKRVEIIDVLSQGERSVESLAEQISASVANTSRHLQILAAAGLVVRRIEASARIYRLSDASVEAAYRALVGLSETHIAAVTALAEAFFAESDGAKPVSFEEFDEMSRSGGVLLIDVRPASEFLAGHADGAVNVPVADLASRLSELPADATIVAYCRGPYCVMASSAVSRLRRSGFTASRLDGGYPQWRSAGRPTAHGGPAASGPDPQPARSTNRE